MKYVQEKLLITLMQVLQRISFLGLSKGMVFLVMIQLLIYRNFMWT